MSQYGLAGKNKIVTVDKSRGMVDNAAMVLQVQKEPKIQANEVPDVSESPTRQLRVALKSG